MHCHISHIHPPCCSRSLPSCDPTDPHSPRPHYLSPLCPQNGGRSTRRTCWRLSWTAPRPEASHQPHPNASWERSASLLPRAALGPCRFSRATRARTSFGLGRRLDLSYVGCRTRVNVLVLGQSDRAMQRCARSDTHQGQSVLSQAAGRWPPCTTEWNGSACRLTRQSPHCSVACCAPRRSIASVRLERKRSPLRRMSCALACTYPAAHCCLAICRPASHCQQGMPQWR